MVDPDPTRNGGIPASTGATEHAVDDREAATSGSRLWAITLRGPDGRRYPPRHVKEDLDQPDSFRPHLLAIARMEDTLRTDSGENWIGEFELEVREPGKEHKEPQLILRWQKN